jgi:hypothetical protein
MECRREQGAWRAPRPDAAFSPCVPQPLRRQTNGRHQQALWVSTRRRLPGHCIRGSFESPPNPAEICADRDTDQRLKLGSSERDRSRLVQGTVKLKG